MLANEISLPFFRVNTDQKVTLIIEILGNAREGTSFEMANAMPLESPVAAQGSGNLFKKIESGFHGIYSACHAKLSLFHMCMNVCERESARKEVTHTLPYTCAKHDSPKNHQKDEDSGSGYPLRLRGKGERKFPIFAQPKLSITPIIAFAELVDTSRVLNHSIYRYIGVAVSAQIAIRPFAACPRTICPCAC